MCDKNATFLFDKRNSEQKPTLQTNSFGCHTTQAQLIWAKSFSFNIYFYHILFLFVRFLWLWFYFEISQQLLWILYFWWDNNELKKASMSWKLINIEANVTFFSSLLLSTMKWKSNLRISFIHGMHLKKKVEIENLTASRIFTGFIHLSCCGIQSHYTAATI